MTTVPPCPLSTACPPHVEDTHGILEHPERRALLKQGVLAAIGATLVTACASHNGQAPTPAAPTANAAPIGMWSLRVRLTDFPALQQDGGIARVDPDSDIPVAVVRTGTMYTAISMICTHAGATLDIVQNGFSCPRHGAQYSADGTWTGGHAAKHLKVLGSSYDTGSAILTITT
jgi:Rieske Fe-S protein